MGLSKYIKHREITKVIDPGNGSLPSSVIQKDPKIVPSQAKARTITDTSLSVTVKDLISIAQQTQQEVVQVIDSVVQHSVSDSGFKVYVDMVKANHFNPMTLIEDSKARPVKIFQPNQIKAAERDVYRRLVDPRAPFVQDLHDHLADAGLSEYVLTNYWRHIVSANALHDGFAEDENIPRYLLGKEEQHLEQLRQSVRRIEQNKIEKLTYGFLNAFASRITSRIHATIPKDQLREIENLIRTLKQIRLVLTATSILNTESWEKFYSNVKDIYGDFLQLTAMRIAKTSAYSFIFGIQDKVFDFLDGFENYIPFDLDLFDIPESRELMLQVEGCFGTFLSQVEDDLVYREGIQLKLEENRQLLFLNSKKNSKTKQFVSTIDGVIHHLQIVRDTLYSLNSQFRLDVGILTQELVNQSDNYAQSVASIFGAEDPSTISVIGIAEGPPIVIRRE